MQFNKIESFAGFCAGVSGTCIGYPLDVIKTRMQTNQSGIRSSAQQIYQQSGIRGFYRGIVSPLVSLSILNTLNFSTYNAFRRALGLASPNEFDERVYVAGGAVGIVCALISTPFEMAKLQSQLNPSNRNNSSNNSSNSSSRGNIGALRAASNMITNHGFRSLYTGHMVNTVREILFLSTYFTSYECLKGNLSSIISNSVPNWCRIPIAGGIAGAMGWFISFPLDAVKSNIQGRNLSSAERTSAIQIFSNIIRTKGILGIYSGLGPSLLRSFLVSSCRFAVYEFVYESNSNWLNE